MITRRSLFGLAILPFLKLPVINNKEWKFKEKHSLKVLLDTSRYCVSIDGVILPCVSITDASKWYNNASDCYVLRFEKKMGIDFTVPSNHRVHVFQDQRRLFVMLVNNHIDIKEGDTASFQVITPVENLIV